MNPFEGSLGSGPDVDPRTILEAGGSPHFFRWRTGRSDATTPFLRDRCGHIPLAGQQVHTIEFPEVASLEEVQEIHSTYRVRVVDGEAQLEKL